MAKVRAQIMQYERERRIRNGERLEVLGLHKRRINGGWQLVTDAGRTIAEYGGRSGDRYATYDQGRRGRWAWVTRNDGRSESYVLASLLDAIEGTGR